MVAVTSAHRGQAFEACEFLMDYLKTQAPFWKKEHTPEGARWVDARVRRRGVEALGHRQRERPRDRAVVARPGRRRGAAVADCALAGGLSSTRMAGLSARHAVVNCVGGLLIGVAAGSSTPNECCACCW